jgi:hypothetical protein
MAVTKLSTDGITNSQRFNNLRAGFAGTNRIVIWGASARLYSNDGGATWVATTQATLANAQFTYPVTKNGRIYALSSGTTNWSWSYDGITWYYSQGYPGDANATPYFFGEMANGEVAIGSYYNSTRHHLLREFMGFNGSIGAFGVPFDISGTMFANNGVTGPAAVWVWVFSSTTLAYSTNDGLTWTNFNMGQFPPQAIVWGLDKFLLTIGSSTTYLTATAANPASWTTRTLPTTPAARSSIRYLNGLWLLGGISGQLFTSPDGITWTSRTSGAGSNSINGFGFAANLYVAVGAGGYVATSPDGITWTSRSSGVTSALHVVGGI